MVFLRLHLYPSLRCLLATVHNNIHKHHPAQHLSSPQTRNISTDHVNRTLSISIIGSRQGNSRRLESRKSPHQVEKQARNLLRRNRQKERKSLHRHHHAPICEVFQRTTALPVENGRPKARISRHRCRRLARGRVQLCVTACNENNWIFLNICIYTFVCIFAFLSILAGYNGQWSWREERWKKVNFRHVIIYPRNEVATSS